MLCGESHRSRRLSVNHRSPVAESELVIIQRLVGAT
jgi:hypothetical protein